MEDYILIKEVAIELGLDRSTTLKTVKRLNIPTVKVRDIKAGGQLCSAVNREGFDLLISTRETSGFGQGPRKECNTSRNVCYIIQVNPERMPERIKVGVSTDMQGRLSTYRTICPEASIVAAWYAPASCEGYMIAVGQEHGEQVGAELFDIEDVESFLSLMSNAFCNFQQLER